MLRLDRDLPEGDEKQKRNDSNEEEEALPMKIMETQWDENRDEKDRKAGCGFMKSYGFTPVSMLICLSNDGKNAWKISPRTNTQKKEKKVKSLITFCPSKS
jgi:hypothetical protein